MRGRCGGVFPGGEASAWPSPQLLLSKPLSMASACPPQPGDLVVQPGPGGGDASRTFVEVALGFDSGNDAPAEAPAVLVLEAVPVEEGA